MSGLAQASLFDVVDPEPAIEGLSYASHVVTGDAEREVAAFVEGLALQPFAYRGFTGKRRTISFGWRYDFNGGGFQRADALPRALIRVRERVAEALGQVASDFEQCSVIEYGPGAGIGWHKDRPHFGKVAGLSLLAPCTLRFRQTRVGGGWERQSLLLAPRSAYLLDGEARMLWQHSISPLDRLRYSITFRSLAESVTSSDARAGARAKL